jgi:hypothetical protein
MNKQLTIKETKNAAELMCHYYFYKFFMPAKNEELAELSYEDRKELDRNGSAFFAFKMKYLKYFDAAADMFASREDFEAKTFIDSVLSESFLYPAQIPVEKNWKIYLRNSQETEEHIVRGMTLTDTIKSAKDFFTFLNGRKIKDICNSLILSQDLIDDYAQDELNLTVLCFSKSFKEFSKKENMIIDFKEEQSKIDERLKEKIKKKLEDDFFEEE